MIPLKGRRERFLHVAFCFFILLLDFAHSASWKRSITNASSCTYIPPDCYDADCVKETECEHGECTYLGQCQCVPCYTGESCSDYDDKYGPMFPIREDAVVIYPHHQGAVYIAKAEDSDLGLTCPLGPGINSRCPCAAIYYHLRQDGSEEVNAFRIDETTGQLFLREGIDARPGQEFELTIIASSVNNSQVGKIPANEDAITLSVVVHQPDPLPDLLATGIRLQAQEQDFPEAVPINVDKNIIDDHPSDTMESGSPLDSVKTSIRRKRNAASPTADDTGGSKMILLEKNSPPAILQPGNTVEYELTVILPKLTVAMDLVIEVFVMDAISGITPFALCSPAVTSIGNMIKDSTGAPLNMAAINSGIQLQINTQFGYFYDRAVIDFGQVKNDDVVGDGVTNTGPSTITIAFKAVLIKNPLYTNSSVVVTAGAEYDAEKYVWVSQSTMNFTMSPTATYLQDITMTGPNTLAQWTGGTFNINTKITNPFDYLTFEVFTNNIDHDKFTVSQLSITNQGQSFDCAIPLGPNITYYDSVTGLTRYMATLQIGLLLRDLDYTNLPGEVASTDNEMDFSFSIFMYGALPGDIVSVGAGLIIGTSSIWTGMQNITVTAGSPTPAAGNPTAWATATVSNTAVAPNGTVTWGAKATIPAGANALISCTATGSATSVVCGVDYGVVGANIAYMPDLSQLAVFTSPSMSFDVNINSTGGTSNDIVFEVSVHYPSATPGPVTIACAGGFSQTFTATSGVAGVMDMTGQTSMLATDTAWYLGSQAGVNVNLQFPVNSVPYDPLVLESADDLGTAGWGGRVCHIEIVSAGRGVPCISGQKYILNENYVIQKSKTTSVFNDGVSMPLGSGCGVNRLAPSTKDYTVSVNVYYHMPIAQPSAVTGIHNISIGLALGANMIWTGWETFAFQTAALAASDPAKVPIFAVFPPAVTTINIGVPQMVKVTFKTHPGSVGTYIISAFPTDPTLIYVCKIIVLGIGSSYPCLDPDPYGKEIDPNQIPTIIHNSANWGARADMNLGTLRNLRVGTINADSFADEDSIHLAILVKGIAAGAGVLNVQLTNTGVLTNNPVSFTINAIPPASGTLTAVAVGDDGTLDAYDGVMKIVNLEMTVPAGYAQTVTVTVTNTDLLNLGLCYGAVTSAGKNLPCVLPQLCTSNKITTATSEVLLIDLLQVCHYSLVPNITENKVIASIGAMFLPNSASTASLTAVITDGTVVHPPITITLNKLATPFNPGNITTDGMKLELLDNTTTTVTVGQRIKTAVAFTVPKFTTTPIEIGIMTPSDGGRAYVTVHGFSFRAGGGKNLGCLLSDCLLYQPIIIQNSSFTVSMIHSSQTDTLVANLKYITNTGLSYLQLTSLPQDDQIWLEAELMIADHINATNGAIFDISFAVKAGPMIFVIEKQLVLSRTGAELPKIIGEIYLTDNTTTVFVPLQKVGLTLRLYHDMNVSQAEANNAVCRIFLPKYLIFQNLTAPLDTFIGNISGNVTNLSKYIDYDLDYLFFTDILEVNLTVTVDPNAELPKGLGIVNATSILRLVGYTFADTTPRYVSDTAYVLYQVNGPDCFNSLSLATMQDCQFSASTAIDATTAPPKAKSGSGGGWSPAVRLGSSWTHYITIDFLKRTRVTRIQLQPVTSTRQVTVFKMQYSHSGQYFTDACPLQLTVPANNIIDLPLECRFEARYGRMLILQASGVDGSAPIGVRFDWFGCPIETVDGVCSTFMTTALTDTTRGWRHVAYDSVHALFYFCDFIPKKQRISCYSTTNGIAWNALPSYIGRLVGFDAATVKMYAMDKKEVAMVSSTDGINWSIVDTATAATVATTATPAKPVPGKVAAQLTPIVLGPWKADFTGVSFGGAYKAKWANCCT